jgi:hypothetical protein
MNFKGREIEILPQLPMIPNFQVLFLLTGFSRNISDNPPPLF